PRTFHNVKRLVLLLAALLVAAALVGAVRYLEGHQGRSANDAARSRHYFAVGKRACGHLLGFGAPQPIGGITNWHVGVTASEIHVSATNVPPKYRKALQAGCDAAVG